MPVPIAKRRDYDAAWRERNREKLRAYNAEWARKDRRASRTPSQRIATAMRNLGIMGRLNILLDGLRVTKRKLMPKKPKVKVKKNRQTAAYKAEKARWRKRWKLRNPEKYRAQLRSAVKKREALKRGAAVGTDRVAYAQFVLRLQGDEAISCYWCGKNTTPGQRHADHIFPLAGGGSDDVHNLCCACPQCNQSKHAKAPEAFSGQYELRFAA